jgi:hypothetical protein
LNELYSPAPESPNIDFLAPEHLGLLGSTTTFGCASALVRAAYQGCGVAIGLSTMSRMTMVPLPSTKVEWGPEHRVVVLARRVALQPAAPPPSISEWDAVVRGISSGTCLD